jgi:hypothetical protein
VLGRGIAARSGVDPAIALREYLQNGLSLTARLLAGKAVVGLDPPDILGEIMWSSGEREKSQ